MFTLRHRSARPAGLVVLLTLLLVLPHATPLPAQTPQAPSRRVYLPIVTRGQPAVPPATTSYYMERTGLPFFQLAGCAAARELQEQGRTDGIVVLFFGNPAYQEVEDPAGNVRFRYGATLFSPREDPRFGSVAAIRAAVERWVEGFVNGVTTSDWACTPLSSSQPRITLAVGVNNDGILRRDGFTDTSGDWLRLHEHAVAWAELINDLLDYVDAQNLTDRITLAGAYNVEPNYDYPTTTQAWIDAYNRVATAPYYSVGSCDGCTYRRDDGTLVTSLIPKNWTTETIWRANQGTTGIPLPQIYNEVGTSARQWQYVALEARNNSWGQMTFAGAFTQHHACNDRGAGQPNPISGAEYCRGTYNTPSEGWTDLQQALLRSPTTAQNVPWVTDIRWEFDFTRWRTTQ